MGSVNLSSIQLYFLFFFMYLHHSQKLWFLVILAQWLTYFWSQTFWKSRVSGNLFLFSLSQIVSHGQEMKTQFPGASSTSAKFGAKWSNLFTHKTGQNCSIVQLILRSKYSDCCKNEAWTAKTITLNCKR